MSEGNNKHFTFHPLYELFMFAVSLIMLILFDFPIVILFIWVDLPTVYSP